MPLAFNTHREAIRDKILYLILVFAVMMMGAGVLLSFLSLNQEGKIVVDLGLSSISIFGLMITIFIGTTLIHKEIERKTVFLLLPKPLHRAEFILGKYLGLCTTLLVITVAMAATFYAIIALLTRHWEAILDIVAPTGQAILLMYVELMLLTAVAIFFSTFSSSVMSAVFTIGTYVVGHLSQDIVNFGKLSNNDSLILVTKGIYYLLPDLERLNLKNELMFGPGVPPEVLLASAGYGLLYALTLLMLSIWIFNQREF